MSSNLQPLVLHAHGTGPNPYKVAILLEALDLPYHVKLWDFGDEKGGVKGPEFTKINENGRVPALEDPNTGVVSWESGAVMNYILRKYDTSHKYSPSPDADMQAHVDFEKWVYFLVSSLGPMMGQVNWFRHYHPNKNQDALERYEAQSYRCYDVLEGQLKKTDGKSILPTGYSAVDMHFYPWVAQHKFAQLSLANYPLLSQWMGSIAGRKEVVKAYKTVPEGKHA